MPELPTPASVLEQKIDGSIRYTLKIQKQSGIIELPITLRLIFPEGSDIIKASGTLKQDGSLLTGQLRLREDIHIEVIWLPPDR